MAESRGKSPTCLVYEGRIERPPTPSKHLEGEMLPSAIKQVRWSRRQGRRSFRRKTRDTYSYANKTGMFDDITREGGEGEDGFKNLKKRPSNRLLRVVSELDQARCLHQLLQEGAKD